MMEDAREARLEAIRGELESRIKVNSGLYESEGNTHMRHYFCGRMSGLRDALWMVQSELRADE